jgi:hypothetical protein
METHKFISFAEKQSSKAGEVVGEQTDRDQNHIENFPFNE